MDYAYQALRCQACILSERRGTRRNDVITLIYFILLSSLQIPYTYKALKAHIVSYHLETLETFNRGWEKMGSLSQSIWQAHGRSDPEKDCVGTYFDYSDLWTTWPMAGSITWMQLWEASSRDFRRECKIRIRNFIGPSVQC